MAINVASQADWNTAVATVAAAGAGSTTTINLTGGFTLTSSMAQLQASNANVTVNITGNGQTIDGGPGFQGIVVDGANAPTVNISNLTIANTAAQGGSGEDGQDGFLSGSLSYGAGGGGGGGLGTGGGLLVGSGANVTISSVTFTGNSATGGAGGNGGAAQDAAADLINGGNGGAGGAANNGGASGGGGAGGTGGHAGDQGTGGTAGASLGDGGGGGGGSGTTISTRYTDNNFGGAGNAGGGGGAQGGGGVANYGGQNGPGADGAAGGGGGSARGGAIYVATGGTLSILDTAISGASVTGGHGGLGGTGLGWSSFGGQQGYDGAAAGAGIFLSGVQANIGVSSGTITYADSIAGDGGFSKVGLGALTLSNSNFYTGPTTVGAGTLIVNGSIEFSLLTTVNSGGRLGGSGTVGATVIESGGILAPGNSIGTLKTGALTYRTGAIHEVELADGGNAAGIHNDLIQASKQVTINSGAVLRVVPENGTDTGEFYDPGLTYRIISSTVGVHGTFGSVIDDYLFLNFVDSYDDYNVYLTSQIASFCLAGSTANQCAAAEGVQATAPSALYTALLTLTDADVARAAFDQLSGEMHASATGMLLQDSSFARDAANDRLRSAFGQPATTSLPILAYGEGGAEIAAADTDRFAVWGNAFGSWGKNGGDGNAAAFDRSLGSLLMGGDALVGDNLRVGLMTGFSRSSFDVDGRNSSGEITGYHLGAYGGGQWGVVSLRTGVAYTWNSLDTRRAVTIPGLSEVLSADYDAGTAQIFGEAGYRIDTAGASFEPFANLAYVNVRTDAFTETGGSAALSQAGSSTDATFTTLGIRASGDVALGTVNATARGMVGWRHAFGDVTPLSTLAFDNGDAFIVAGAPIARNAAVVEAGLDFDIAPTAKLGVSYTGQFGSGVSDNGAKLDLSIRF